MPLPANGFRLDRYAFEVTEQGSASSDVQRWAAQPVAMRLRAVELLRQTFYGHARATRRLQRFFEAAQRT